MNRLIIVLIIFSCVLSSNLISQEQTSAASGSSSNRLPQAGDISFGIDALPYLNYIGNIFNNTANNTLALGSNRAYLRYFLSDETAIRAIISINSTTNITKSYVQDDAAVFADPLSQAKVIDKTISSNRGYGLNLGFMKFRGYERVRGFYGVQIGYFYNRNISRYEYGNAMTVANPSPSTSFLGRVAERTLENDNGIVQSIGGGGFIGVEYFFLPKICIGGELSLSFVYTWGSQSNTKTETILNGERIEKNNVVSPGNKSYVLTTFRPATYGGLYVMFHF